MAETTKAHIARVEKLDLLRSEIRRACRSLAKALAEAREVEALRVDAAVDLELCKASLADAQKRIEAIDLSQIAKGTGESSS